MSKSKACSSQNIRGVLRGATVASFVLLTASAALGYSKNLTGLWRTPKGWPVAIRHTPGSGRATFVATFETEETGRRTLVFPGQITGANSPGFFNYVGHARSFDIMLGGRVCRAMPTFYLYGAMVGDVGGRLIHAQMCGLQLPAICGKQFRNGIELSCVGVWR